MSFNTIIHKADPIVSREPVNGVVIEIIRDLPECDTLDDARDLYGKDAEDIFRALKNNLPQGTRYRLTQLLLVDSENLYRGL